MGVIERRLEELGIRLLPPSPPSPTIWGRSGRATGSSCRHESVSGRVPWAEDLTTREAYEAARATMLHILSIVREDIDLDEIASIDKMNGFVRSAPSFTDHPKVIDGASDVLVEIFGDSGRHARTATASPTPLWRGRAARARDEAAGARRLGLEFGRAHAPARGSAAERRLTLCQRELAKDRLPHHPALLELSVVVLMLKATAMDSSGKTSSQHWAPRAPPPWFALRAGPTPSTSHSRQRQPIA